MFGSEIGLSLLGLFGSSPLYMGITFAIFKSSGKWPSLNDLLKIITKPLITSCFTCFSNDTLISIVALFLSWFISLRTSLLSVGRKNKLSFIGLVK